MSAHRPYRKPVVASEYTLRAEETPESRDDRILDGLRAGDARALEAAFHAYYDGLFGQAYRYTRSGEIAEELIQDVFLRMWDRRDQLVGSERLQPLMFAAVRNASISWLRRQKLEHRLAEQAVAQGATTGMSQFASDMADAVRLSNERDVAAELREAIEMLPERARLAITLRWQRQLRNTEIAQVMGVSVKAVEFSIARALNQLRRILEPGR